MAACAVRNFISCPYLENLRTDHPIIALLPTARKVDILLMGTVVNRIFFTTFDVFTGEIRTVNVRHKDFVCILDKPWFRSLHLSAGDFGGTRISQ